MEYSVCPEDVIKKTSESLTGIKSMTTRTLVVHCLNELLRVSKVILTMYIVTEQ